MLLRILTWQNVMDMLGDADLRQDLCGRSNTPRTASTDMPVGE